MRHGLRSSYAETGLPQREGAGWAKSLDPGAAAVLFVSRYRATPGRARDYMSFVPLKFGIFKRGLPDVESALNQEGRDGWRFRQMVVQASSNLGESIGMIAIFERATE